MTEKGFRRSAYRRWAYMWWAAALVFAILAILTPLIAGNSLAAWFTFGGSALLSLAFVSVGIGYWIHGSRREVESSDD